MKLVSYIKDEHEQLGVLINDMVYDMEVLHPDLPNSMNICNCWHRFLFLKVAEMVMLFGSMWHLPEETVKWI